MHPDSQPVREDDTPVKHPVDLMSATHLLCKFQLTETAVSQHTELHPRDPNGLERHQHAPQEIISSSPSSSPSGGQSKGWGSYRGDVTSPPPSRMNVQQQNVVRKKKVRREKMRQSKGFTKLGSYIIAPYLYHHTLWATTLKDMRAYVGHNNITHAHKYIHKMNRCEKWVRK